jgi:hypothetical protein
MKTRIYLMSTTLLFGLVLSAALVAAASEPAPNSNANGDVLAEFTVSAGGGVSEQPNGCTLALTIGFVAATQEPVVKNASGAELAMGFQALLLPSPRTDAGDWMLYE